MDSLLMHFHGMLSNIAKKLIMRLIISFFQYFLQRDEIIESYYIYS